MVREPLVNGLQTKCTYVWMGLRTCAVSSANGLHTVHCELKFVGFLRKHKGNWLHQEAPGVLYLPQIRRISHTPNANGLQTVWFTCMYWPLQCGSESKFLILGIFVCCIGTTLNLQCMWRFFRSEHRRPKISTKRSLRVSAPSASTTFSYIRQYGTCGYIIRLIPFSCI